MILDTKEIEKPIFVIVVLLLAAAIAYAGYNYGHMNTNSVVVTPTVAPTPVPTPVDTSYLTNVVTIDEMTSSGGFPQINIIDDNRMFNVPYSYYDILTPGDRVQFHVVNTYVPFSSVVYKVDYVNIISHSWSNTQYYYYDNRYYRDDNRVTVEVTRDEASKHNFVNGRPAHWSG